MLPRRSIEMQAEDVIQMQIKSTEIFIMINFPISTQVSCFEIFEYFSIKKQTINSSRYQNNIQALKSIITNIAWTRYVFSMCPFEPGVLQLIQEQTQILNQYVINISRVPRSSTESHFDSLWKYSSLID